jgi:hypothetical protein
LSLRNRQTKATVQGLAQVSKRNQHTLRYLGSIIVFSCVANLNIASGSYIASDANIHLLGLRTLSLLTRNSTLRDRAANGSRSRKISSFFIWCGDLRSLRCKSYIWLCYLEHRVSVCQAQKTQTSFYDGLSALLGHMGSYFPFAAQLSPMARRDLKVRGKFLVMNVKTDLPRSHRLNRCYRTST